MQTLSKDEARSRIEHEGNLINHRVSWLIGSQSFLLTAFVLLRNNPEYYAPPATLLEPYLQRTSSLVYFIALVGILIAVCSFVGVLAAFFAIRAWKSYVPEDLRSGLTSKARIAHSGGLAAVLPGPVIASIWGLLLASEWATISGHLSQATIWIPLCVSFFVIATWFLFHWRSRLFHFTPRETE